MIHASTLAALIGSGRYDLTDEIRCHADIATLLAAEGWLFEREWRLGPHARLDFLVEGGVAVEVKMNRATETQVLRQMERYADYDAVSALILATNRAMRLPAEIGGKPAHYVSLGWGWL